METPQSEISTATNKLLSMPQHSKLLMVMAALAITTIVIAVNLPKKQASCELIEGCALRNADLQRMQVVLNSAGLSDYEIDGNSIYVPKPKRDVYLKAITDADALPADLCWKEEEVSVNPLLSRDQREQIRMKEKKNQVRDMVTRLPFVEQAWFEMDRVKAKSAFQNEEQSAVIMIQPTGKHLLDRDEIETIRGLITGSIAGMDRNSIVVTDLNAGFAYQGSENNSTSEPALSGTGSLVSSEIRDKRNRYENKIRKALADLEGVSIEVEVVPAPIANQIAAPQKNSNSSAVPVMTLGTNSQAMIESRVTQASHKVEPARALDIQEKVSVKVEIQEALVLAGLEPGPSDTITSLRKSPAYRLRIEEIQSDVTRRIRPMLPASSFSNSRVFPISFSMSREDDAALSHQAGVWPAFFKRIGGPWGAFAVLAAAIFILGFVFMGTNQKPVQDSAPATLEMVSEPEPAAVVTSQDQDIREEISQLIKEDPEAAAQVIKRWIRNAA